MSHEPIASKSSNAGRDGNATHASHARIAGKSVTEERLRLGAYLEAALSALKDAQLINIAHSANLPEGIETWRVEMATEQLRILRRQLTEFIESEYNEK